MIINPQAAAHYGQLNRDRAEFQERLKEVESALMDEDYLAKPDLQRILTTQDSQYSPFGFHYYPLGTPKRFFGERFTQYITGIEDVIRLQRTLNKKANDEFSYSSHLPLDIARGAIYYGDKIIENSKLAHLQSFPIVSQTIENIREEYQQQYEDLSTWRKFLKIAIFKPIIQPETVQDLPEYLLQLGLEYRIERIEKGEIIFDNLFQVSMNEPKEKE